MDFTTNFQSLGSILEGKNKGCMQEPAVLKKWKLLASAIREEKWQEVEKHIIAFEEVFQKTYKINLEKDDNYRRYQHVKQEMMLNITKFTQSLHKTTITVGSSDSAPPDKIQKTYEADAKFMRCWITWLDREVLSKQIIGDLPNDPQNLERENVTEGIIMLEKVMKKAAKMIMELREEKQDLMKLNQGLNTSLSKEESHVRQLQSEVTKLKSVNEELSSNLEKSQEEKEYWMNRMSKVAGNKLTDNNPVITDLSDQNRPQKISERYAELYDNEWTDSLEKLKKGRDTDTSNILKMADMLKICHESCQTIASRQIKRLYQDLIEVSSLAEASKDKSMIVKNRTKEEVLASDVEDIPKSLYDTRKDSSKLVFKSVKQVVMDQLKQKYSSEIKLIPAFVDSCLQIAWQMVIQRPELCFVWPKTGKDEKLNMDQFSYYTTSGNGVEFVVWPAMLLHENGPLLRKGTVQPYPVKK